MKQLCKPRPESILLIDDEPMVGRFVGSILRTAGFEVSYCQSPLEGLHRAIESVPALVITDYEMEELNGAEVCVHLKSREETKEVPVIFISGSAGSDGQEEARFSGGAAFFDKPIASGRLLRVIQDLLAGRGSA